MTVNKSAKPVVKVEGDGFAVSWRVSKHPRDGSRVRVPTIGNGIMAATGNATLVAGRTVILKRTSKPDKKGSLHFRYYTCTVVD